MFIPVCCGRLRFEGGSCFLEHRSTNNHPMRVRLVNALPDEAAGSSPEAASLLEGLGFADGNHIFIDGFLVGDQTDLALAVRGATGAPIHRGILFLGLPSRLEKPVGTRELRRFGDPVLARDMLRNCGKQTGDTIQLTGVETVSPSGIPIIEISTIEGC